MKKNKIALICIFIVVLVILGIFITVKWKGNKDTYSNPSQDTTKDNVKILEDNSLLNVSKQFNETREQGGFRISSIQLIEKDGEEFFTADFTNISTTDRTDYSYFRIKLLDEDNNIIETLPRCY